jgi:sec-independent protein translocase protein TatB
MFDIGFSEIVVIAVVALVVIGPERLPKAARTLGHLFGRLQRYVNDVKADINREIELDELRKLQKEVQTAATELKTSVESAAQGVESGVRDVERELNTAGTEPEMARLTEPGPLPSEPGGELADAAPAEAPRQGALPGFDKI